MEKKNQINEEVCEKCTGCHWYYQNTDTENECEGGGNPCHEYIGNEEDEQGNER